MMKKLLALLLILALALCSAYALAEETQVQISDSLSISFVVPDAYSFQDAWYGDILYAELTPEAEGLAAMTLSIGATEEYADRSINDLSDEELDALIAVSISDFSAPTWAISETTHGTKLIVVDENSDYDEFAEIFTLYNGYFISMLIEPANGAQLTAEELNTAAVVLSDMQFISAQ